MNFMTFSCLVETDIGVELYYKTLLLFSHIHSFCHAFSLSFKQILFRFLDVLRETWDGSIMAIKKEDGWIAKIHHVSQIINIHAFTGSSIKYTGINFPLCSFFPLILSLLY